MTIRLRRKMTLVLSRDADYKQTLYDDEDATLAEAVRDGIEAAFSAEQKVLGTQTEQLKWGDLVAAGLLLEVNGACDVALNGSADLLSIPDPGTGKTARLFLECGITQVDVTAGAADVLVTYAVWGAHA